MFGSSSMGDLVIATGDSSPDNEVFREFGNLGNQWNQGIVDFTGAWKLLQKHAYLMEVIPETCVPDGSYSRNVRT
jgi:hypothetical protein